MGPAVGTDVFFDFAGAPQVVVDSINWAQARRSPTYQQVGWRVDRKTVARVRISAVWRRHPEFTAKRVIKHLAPKHSLRVPWVQHILRDCWRAGARLSAKQWRTGRRIYSPWR